MTDFALNAQKPHDLEISQSDVQPNNFSEIGKDRLKQCSMPRRRYEISSYKGPEVVEYGGGEIDFIELEGSCA